MMMMMNLLAILILVLTVSGQDFDFNRMITLEGQAAEDEVGDFDESK